jgi:hypothetical protein
MTNTTEERIFKAVAKERLRCQRIVDAWDTRSERWADMPMEVEHIKLRILSHIQSGTDLR